MAKMKKRRILSGIKIVCFVVLFCVVLRVFVGEPCTVPSDSMYPAIYPGDRIWIDYVTYGARMPRRLADIPIINVFTWNKYLRELDKKNDWGFNRIRGLRMPRKGDLAVFESPEFPHPLLVKRISSRLKTGDTIIITKDNYDIVHNIVQIEGKQISKIEDSIYIDGKIDSVCVLSQPYYFMRGDNTKNSHDSRFFGYIPYSSIVGKMDLVFFSINSNNMLFDKIRWRRFFRIIK